MELGRVPGKSRTTDAFSQFARGGVITPVKFPTRQERVTWSANARPVDVRQGTRAG
jgi:hypothetical protein